MQQLVQLQWATRLLGTALSVWGPQRKPLRNPSEVGRPAFGEWGFRWGADAGRVARGVTVGPICQAVNIPVRHALNHFLEVFWQVPPGDCEHTVPSNM
eukprot:8137806-Alexandrium_andersonii.AAC.1